MSKMRRAAVLVSAIGIASLAFAQPAFAATTIHDSDTELIPGHNATETVTADASGINLSGHVAKITNASCSTAAVGRGGGADSTSGYLDSTWTFYGTKIDSASAEAGTGGIGGSIDASTTKATVHGPRQSWSSGKGKSFSAKNIVVDGGSAVKWSYVVMTCTVTLTHLSGGDVRTTAYGQS